MPVEPKPSKEVFLAALERSSPAERAAYLDEACAGDADLRRKVEALLQAHERPDALLDQPAARHLAAEGGTLALDFLEPPARPGSLGRLGHYEVLEVVGRGGMGIVLRAFDDKLHRVVAIKVLAPALASNGPSRQRFVREARAAAAVSHDNVIAIHAVEDSGPVPYLVMQFIDGCTLQQKLDRAGPLPVKEILRLGIGIADGLAAAHRHGLVHRDVKPANILLENGVERVKITDFGLARAVDDASLTQSGVIAGTPAYMSPEQANGDKIDHRSDLFSLGSVLYTLCTGHPPFRAETAMAVLKRVCDDTPRPIREINPEIPEWLAAVVARLQAKVPAQRFGSAAEVAALLSRHLAQLQTGTSGDKETRRPGDREQRRRSSLLVSLSPGLLVCLLLAAWLTRGWWFPATPSPSTEPAPVAVQPEPWKPRPPLSADELAKLPDPLDGWRHERWPDGLLASVTGDAKDGVPELVGVIGYGPFRLPRQDPAHWPAQSADGRLVALPCGNTVVLYDAVTGGVVRILRGHTASAHAGDFSADGKRFASGATNGVVKVWDVATGEEELSFQDVANDFWGTAFSPDGKSIVTMAAQGSVKVWDAADGKELKTLGQHEGGATIGVFNAAGSRLATAGLDGLVKIWDWPGGELVKALDGLPNRIQMVAFSADDTLLAAGTQSRVLVWEVATVVRRSPDPARPRHRLDTAGSGLLGFTPDGRTLVAGPHDLPAGQRRAFTRWDVETGTLSETRDVPGPRSTMCGRLSRDGKTVYLMTYLPAEARLGAYDAVTGVDRFPDPGHSGPACAVAFSPNGRTLASGGRDGRVCLWDLADRQGGEVASPRGLTGHAIQIFAVAFSPDGRLLASSSIDGTIRVSDVETGRVVHELSTGPGPTPVPLAFSPDGETLAAGGENGGVRLWAVATGQPREPVRWHVGFVHAVAFSPDGRWLASGGIDKTVQLIDRATGTRVHTFRAGTLITCLAFSPDSRALAATSDGSGPPVRVWDITTKAERTVNGDTGRVMGLTFHPQGDRVATASLDGTARLWETSPAIEAGRVFDFRPTGPSLAVAFTPSGRHLAVGLNNGLIAVIRTPPAR